MVMTSQEFKFMILTSNQSESMVSSTASGASEALAERLIGHMGVDRALDICEKNGWDAVADAIRFKQGAVAQL